MEKRKKKKYRLKKWVKTTLKILLVIFIIIIALIITKKIFKKINESKPEINTNTEISSLRYKYNNLDIIGKIEIKNLNLSEILTKTTDNNYYLEHDIYKNKSEYGNPYIDYRNDSDLIHEKQINIYSHNIENKLYSEYYPFSKLEKLLDKDIFNKDNEIVIYTDNRIIKYQIYAIKIITEKENEHMIINRNNEIEWQKHLDSLLKDAKYCKKNCILDNEDDILILQTCYYTPQESYLLVIAKKI